MANPDGTPENLISLADRTTEEQRLIASEGGKASAKSRREKKLLSELYAELLEEEYGINEGHNLKNVIKAIFLRMDSSSVSMLKEIREATEGSKIEHTGTLISEFVKQLRQE
jgi:hypothetical protein